MTKMQFVIKNVKMLFLEVRMCFLRARQRHLEWVTWTDPEGREMMRSLGLEPELLKNIN